MIAPVDKPNVLRVKIPDDSHGCCNSGLLISIAPEELSLLGFVNNIDNNGVTLRNDSLSIKKVREGDGRVLLQ